MSIAPAFQEETAQEYEPGLAGWYKEATKVDPLQEALEAKWKKGGVTRYPVWEVSSGSVDAGRTQLSTKRPIEVEVRRGEELFFVESANLHIFAAGDTEKEAFEDFCFQVVHQFHHYVSTPSEQLVGEAIHLKGLFEGLFVEE